MKSHIPTVIVLASVIHEGLQQMLRGIIDYAHAHGPWRFHLGEDRTWGYPVRDYNRLKPDAIIAADHHSVEDAKRIAACGVPVITLLQAHPMRAKDYPLRCFSHCLWDSKAIGEMAAAHFIRRGYHNFAFADDSNAGTYWSVDRERAFRKSLPPKANYFRYGGANEEERTDWVKERPRLASWLRTLPKPCAVFAPNDRRGHQVLDACFTEGISVPGEVAILGVDDDPYICEASLPTLSSIRCDTYAAGQAIAAHLDDLLHGKTKRRIVVSVMPIEIVTRQSTDWNAVNDEKVAKTLQSLQHRYSVPKLSVTQLAREVGIARRTLEIRFRNVTGKTIHEELESIRLSKARALLRDPSMSVASVAEEVGYSSPTQFYRAYRGRFGHSPRADRK